MKKKKEEKDLYKLWKCPYCKEETMYLEQNMEDGSTYFNCLECGYHTYKYKPSTDVELNGKIRIKVTDDKIKVKIICKKDLDLIKTLLKSLSE